MRFLFFLVCALSGLAFAGQATAAPPVLTSVGHVQRHPQATWSLPPGVQSRVAEVATSPATSTDGYFFFENVKAFSTLEDAQTTWIYNLQLDPGTYYVHVAGYDEPCVLAGQCPFREFSQIQPLVIEAPPPPPPPRPRYEATVRSTHPGAIRDPSLDVPRRHRPCRVPKRYGSPPGRPNLPRLLHEEPPPCLSQSDDCRTPLGCLAASDHASVGRVRGRSLSEVRRVHLASRPEDRRP